MPRERDSKAKGKGKTKGKAKGLAKKKYCKLCFEKVGFVDYKDEKRLGRFVTDRGKIVPRYQITMATGLDEATCRRVNLGYIDYRKLDYESMRADPDTLVVADAGRDLYQVS